MRVVLTVERYAPAIGGAERVVQRIAEGLAARGHSVHVVTSGLREDTRINGVCVHRFPVAGNEARGITGNPARALQLIDALRPDVLFNYAAQTWTTDACASLLGRSARPAMVLAPCGFSGLRQARYASYFRRMPDRLRAYDAVILHSWVYQDARVVEQAGVEHVHVVPNGADPAAPGDHLRRKVGDRKLAVTVGSHVLSKGHGDFARAVSRLARRHPDLVGAIVAPPRRGRDAVRGCQVVCHTRARLRPRRLMVLDGSTFGVVGDAVAAADLFLFASRIECAPLVILEAMAAGTPWASYDVGNVRELAGGIVATGFDELVEAADRILFGELSDLGTQGHVAWQARHRWEDIVASYERIFTALARDPVVR